MGNYSDETSQYMRGEGDAPRSFGRSNDEIAAEKTRVANRNADLDKKERAKAMNDRFSSGQSTKADRIELGLEKPFTPAPEKPAAAPATEWKPFSETPSNRSSNPKRSFGSRLLGHFSR